ncbi:MAG: DUF4238 domain-containing protein [Planctomycetes bacterium]|nr:DUF4238 domain-containing protein [Planctomycetota bacterium]
MPSKKRNHYIPRLLLRRFAFRETSKGQAYLWMLSKDKAVEVESKNAGVASHFYGDPDNNVEDDLADVEAGWRGLLNEVDSGTNNLEHRRTDIWRFAWLLGMRTQASRGHFSAAVEKLLAEMATGATTTGIWCTSPFVERTIEEEWTRALANVPVERRETIGNDSSLKREMLAAAREHFDAHAAALVRHLREAGIGGAIAGVTQGQIRGMKALLAQPDAPIDKFAPESWSVLSFAPHSVILGDGVVFTVGQDGLVGSVGRFKDDLEAIYVPVSHHQVLVGFRRGVSLLDVDAVNEASARLSRDYILASRNTSYETALRLQIGSAEPLISEAERVDLLASVWRDLGHPGASGGTAPGSR